MPAQFTDADTITMLVATDNHVGYAERDQVRSKDSQETFKEIMNLAKERDVDMVLLAGDLFHDNKPSRMSMYNVMEALRTNCLGDRPCELEMLSDGSEHFQGIFNHVNYEDQDINVAIPVFSIHGNHDDPTGEGTTPYSALDLLHMSGLLNYYGKMAEADKIEIKPVLLQKGRTKLALYGMSNIRDERLFRTFKAGNVTFYQPNVQKGDWFNIMSVHQNHHAHTTTGYLPENFLPDFMDLVIWGHEHECLIEPRWNPEMTFHVMQPGSSVATSLMPGEAVPKHVAIVKITGKEFKSEPVLLKSVRPFVMREIVLAEERALHNIWKKDNNRTEITRHLISIVDDMIREARRSWREAQDPDKAVKKEDCPKPLVRLRVEYSAPDGGSFDCENPQRFSNRFEGQVANVSDVVQFYRKKVLATRKSKDGPDLPDAATMEELSLDSVKVEKLVREFLTAQSLNVLPQNRFGDSVSQFVDKDDKHSMEAFVVDSLKSHQKMLVAKGASGTEEIAEGMDEHKSHLEGLHDQGRLKASKRTKMKPKPEHWDSDLDGAWEDQPAALIHSDSEEDAEEATEAPVRTTGTRGRGRGTGHRAATASTRKTAAVPKKVAPAARGSRSKKVAEEENDDDSDVQIISNHDEDDEEDTQAIFVKPSRSAARKPTAKPPSRRIASPTPVPARRTAASKQSTLNFSQSTRRAPASGRVASKPIELSDDEISDDDDAFDPPPSSTSRPAASKPRR